MLAINKLILSRCSDRVFNQCRGTFGYLKWQLIRSFCSFDRNVPSFALHPLGNEKFTEYLGTIEKELAKNNNSRANQKLSKRQCQLKEILDVFKRRQTVADNLKTLVEDLANETDSELLKMAQLERIEFEENLNEDDDELVDRVLYLNENDDHNIIHLQVTAGVGGAEAQHFASQLFELYVKYTLFKGWNVSIDESSGGTFAGANLMRKATLTITGADSFRTLKLEAGVHRVQRIPVTEKGGRIHTSTVTVSAIPQPDDIEIVLNPKDLKIETMCSGGPGGQNVNKLQTAVRITHLPSGIAVRCEDSRSQIQNKALALERLRNKIYLIEYAQQVATSDNLRKSQVKGADRNYRIRTYNFKDGRITDHRVEKGTMSNLDGFFQGKDVMDEFIYRLRLQHNRTRLLEIIGDT